jgi:hypothetical protein
MDFNLSEFASSYYYEELILLPFLIFLENADFLSLFKDKSIDTTSRKKAILIGLYDFLPYRMIEYT